MYENESVSLTRCKITDHVDATLIYKEEGNSETVAVYVRFYSKPGYSHAEKEISLSEATRKGLKKETILRKAEELVRRGLSSMRDHYRDMLQLVEEAGDFTGYESGSYCVFCGRCDDR